MKKFVLLGLLTMLAATLRADALYWMVDTSASDAFYKGDDAVYAGLYSVKSDPGISGKPSKDAAGVNKVDMAEVLGGKAGPMLSDIGDDAASYSFFVELFNAEGLSLHASDVVTYSQLLSSGYISTGGISVPNFTATAGFNGASVPEPTSGLLVVIGGALLALRRRRA